MKRYRTHGGEKKISLIGWFILLNNCLDRILTVKHWLVCSSRGLSTSLYSHYNGLNNVFFVKKIVNHKGWEIKFDVFEYFSVIDEYSNGRLSMAITWIFWKGKENYLCPNLFYRLIMKFVWWIKLRFFNERQVFKW